MLVAGKVPVRLPRSLTDGLDAACVVQGTKDFDDEKSYRIPIGIQFIWAAILAGGLVLLPESPRWLLVKNREADAMKSLSRLFSAPENSLVNIKRRISNLANPMSSEVVLEEYREIMANILHERAISSTSYFDCFRYGEGKNRLRVMTGIGLQALQQLTGAHSLFVPFILRSV